MPESDEIRREAQELSILSGAFLRLAQRLHDRATALEAAVGGGPANQHGGGDAPRESDPLAPAVMMATNLAALGHSREEIRAVLVDSFDLADPEPVLDRALS